MPPRLAMVLGLLAGVVTAVIVVGVIVAFVPGPVHPTPGPSPAASATAASFSPSPSPSGSPSASASATGSPTISPSASPFGSPAASGSALFGVGLPAPSLRVTKVGGGTFDLAELRGKPVWVNFMQTTCPPCIDEFPLMNGFAVRYASTGLVVVAVDIREDEGTVLAFAEGLNATFPVALDADGSAQRTWGALALPVHFWVDAEGIVRAGALGGIGPDVMATSLQKILPGTTVSP